MFNDDQIEEMSAKELRSALRQASVRVRNLEYAANTLLEKYPEFKWENPKRVDTGSGSIDVNGYFAPCGSMLETYDVWKFEQFLLGREVVEGEPFSEYGDRNTDVFRPDPSKIEFVMSHSGYRSLGVGAWKEGVHEEGAHVGSEGVVERRSNRKTDGRRKIRRARLARR